MRHREVNAGHEPHTGRVRQPPTQSLSLLRYVRFVMAYVSMTLRPFLDKK